MCKNEKTNVEGNAWLVSSNEVSWKQANESVKQTNSAQNVMWHYQPRHVHEWHPADIEERHMLSNHAQITMKCAARLNVIVQRIKSFDKKMTSVIFSLFADCWQTEFCQAGPCMSEPNEHVPRWSDSLPWSHAEEQVVHWREAGGTHTLNIYVNSFQ